MQQKVAENSRGLELGKAHCNIGEGSMHMSILCRWIRNSFKLVIELEIERAHSFCPGLPRVDRNVKS